MELPRGSKPREIRQRILLRAEAIYRGAAWGEESDVSDINTNEQNEIDAAKKLAIKWAGGQ